MKLYSKYKKKKKTERSLRVIFIFLKNDIPLKNYLPLSYIYVYKFSSKSKFFEFFYKYNQGILFLTTFISSKLIQAFKLLYHHNYILMLSIIYPFHKILLNFTSNQYFDSKDIISRSARSRFP